MVKGMDAEDTVKRIMLNKGAVPFLSPPHHHSSRYSMSGCMEMEMEIGDGVFGLWSLESGDGDGDWILLDMIRWRLENGDAATGLRT